MVKTYTETEVIAMVKTRLKLAFGAVTLTDAEILNIAEQAGVKINNVVNDSDSNLFGTDVTSGSFEV